MEAIGSRLEAIASRLKAIASRLKAITSRFEAIATWFEGIAIWLMKSIFIFLGPRQCLGAGPAFPCQGSPAMFELCFLF